MGCESPFPFSTTVAAFAARFVRMFFRRRGPTQRNPPAVVIAHLDVGVGRRSLGRGLCGREGVSAPGRLPPAHSRGRAEANHRLRLGRLFFRLRLLFLAVDPRLSTVARRLEPALRENRQSKTPKTTTWIRSRYLGLRTHYYYFYLSACPLMAPFVSPSQLSPRSRSTDHAAVLHAPFVGASPPGWSRKSFSMASQPFGHFILGPPCVVSSAARRFSQRQPAPAFVGRAVRWRRFGASALERTAPRWVERPSG